MPLLRSPVELPGEHVRLGRGYARSGTAHMRERGYCLARARMGRRTHLRRIGVERGEFRVHEPAHFLEPLRNEGTAASGSAPFRARGNFELEDGTETRPGQWA